MANVGQTEKPTGFDLSRLASYIVFSFGILVTVIWLMGLPILWFGEWATKITRPNSGLGLFIAGLALRLVDEKRMAGSWCIPGVGLKFSIRQSVQILGLLLVVMAGLTIIESLFSIDFHIDAAIVLQRWFREFDSQPARMTLFTAVELLLTGLAFVSFDGRIGRRTYPAEILAAIMLVLSLDSLIAFLYMNDSLPDIRSDNPIPIISSVMFVILAVGMLAARQRRGIVAIWVAKYNGSALVRKWLPVGILAFVLTGEIVDIMQDYRFLRPGVSLSIFTVVVISLIAVVLLFSAVHLNESEKELIQTSKLYETLSQSNQAMVRTRDKTLLLKEVCDIMVKYGGFRMSWISTVGAPEAEPTVDACSGIDCGNLMNRPEFLRDFLEVPAVNQVLKGKESCVFNCIETDDIPTGLTTHLVETGQLSMTVLRLTSFERTAGILTVSSSEEGFFREREMALLHEIALDLSFALESLEKEVRKDRTEKALRESEERFRATFEKAAVGIVLLTPSGIVMRANPRFCRITGYEESELKGRSFVDITHKEDADEDVDNLQKMLRGEIVTYSREKRYIRKDGTPVWAHLSGALARDADGEPINVISIVQDISERKEAEELLRRSREQYQKFFEEDITADFISDVDGNILACNPAFVRIFGFSSVDEALAANANDIYPTPERRKEFLRLLQDVKKIEYQEITLRRKDRSQIYVIASSFGVFDENGRLIQTKSYLFDDTPRKTLQNQILQTQKMESLGTLAGGIAHDFNNILGIIMGHAGLLKKKELDEGRFSRSLEAIDLAARRGAGLIRQLLTFARKEERVSESLNVNDIITDLQRLLNETLPRIITIRLELTEELPPIIGDPNQIHQALLNLCVNARDAMLDRQDGKPPGGNLTITSAVDNGKTVRDKFPEATGENYLKITVADTGMGMDDATRVHIFEPFFTTKERGKGTGLGLATVYGIVEGHEGFIDVLSEPGFGTTITIYLPAKPPETRMETSPDNQTAELKGGSETILIVEDEEMLTDFLREILTRKGYKVITAPDGETALTIYSERFKGIDLVLSDLGLPKLGGANLLHELMKIHSKVRVIFASGFLEPDVKSAIANAGANIFIQKPYSAAEVLRKVREVLDS